MTLKKFALSSLSDQWRRSRGWRLGLRGGLIFMLVVLVVGPARVQAHAVPEWASPPIEGVVPALPAQLQVWFSEEFDPRSSRLSVIGPDGQPADLGDSAVDLTDPSRQLFKVSLKPNGAVGSYVVQWQTVSILDADSVDGSFQFTVYQASAYDFDERAWGISLGAGLAAALFIYGFGRLMRVSNRGSEG